MSTPNSSMSASRSSSVRRNPGTSSSPVVDVRPCHSPRARMACWKRCGVTCAWRSITRISPPSCGDPRSPPARGRVPLRGRVWGSTRARACDWRCPQARLRSIVHPNAQGGYSSLVTASSRAHEGTHGPYAKGLAWQDGYPTVWAQLSSEHPEAVAGSSNLYQNWETVDPETWVPDGYACVRVDSRGAGRSPGRLDVWSPRETRDFYDCIE